MATPLDMIEAHLTWMRAGKFADNTIRDARGRLRRLHQDLPMGIDGATGEELATWLASDGWSEQTVSTYYKHIVRFYRWATSARDPWLSFDPSADLRRPSAQPGLPRPALDSIVQRCIFDLVEPWRLACRLAALAGLRPCEIATITRADVTEGWITIKGKGGKTRAIPTHPLIWETVWSRPAGPLITYRGRPVSAEYVSRAGAYYLRRAGLGITLYRLRHYFGTVIQERYRDIRVTQKLMGHASITTTEVYTLVTDQRMREAIDCLPFSGRGVGTAAAPSSLPAAGEASATGAAAPQPRLQPSGGDRRVGGRVVRPRSRRPRR